MNDRLIALIAFLVALVSLSALDSCSVSAAAVPPRPRLARHLRGDQVVRAISAAPAGARVSVPVIAVREWQADGTYSAGDTCSLSGSVYVCVQSHASLPGWRPPAVPALWRLVRAASDAPGLPPAWRQPQGAHDAYAKGDRVTFGGKTWVSTITANVWAPGVYGWDESQ